MKHAPSKFLAVSTLCMIAVVPAYAADAQMLDTAELAQERQLVEQWKADRVASLTSETGWLTLAGLFWLEPGANTFGSGTGNTLRLEHAALAPEAGSFHRDGSKVTFVASAGSGVTHEGAPVTELTLASDLSDAPTILQSGTLSFYLIDRAGNLGIRVRDSAHPLRTAFHGLDYFPYDDSWVMDARFEAYAPHRQIPIVNILGMTENIPSSGALVFTHGGQEYRLDALLETPDSEELFIMFADATTGAETYGAGRYLYVPLPQDGRVRVNFNTAYNPPCTFNVFATCPLPPPQNRLPVRVEAGELNYASPHLDE